MMEEKPCLFCCLVGSHDPDCPGAVPDEAICELEQSPPGSEIYIEKDGSVRTVKPS